MIAGAGADDPMLTRDSSVIMIFAPEWDRGSGRRH